MYTAGKTAWLKEGTIYMDYEAMVIFLLPTE
jgi:hypothetical protein